MFSYVYLWEKNYETATYELYVSYFFFAFDRQTRIYNFVHFLFLTTSEIYNQCDQMARLFV